MQFVAFLKGSNMESTNEPPRTCLAIGRMHQQTCRVVAAPGWKVGRWDKLQSGPARLPRAGLENDSKRVARGEHTRDAESHLVVM